MRTWVDINEAIGIDKTEGAFLSYQLFYRSDWNHLNHSIRLGESMQTMAYPLEN
jgi:hypothetical protein